MLLIRFILGALFLGAFIGMVLAVLLASNHREQTFLFLNSLRLHWFNFTRKFRRLFRLGKSDEYPAAHVARGQM
jgi:hypothetical protein